MIVNNLWYLIPALISIILLVFLRTCVLYGGKKIPRILIIAGLVAGFVPLLNLIVLPIVIFGVVIFFLCDEDFKFKNEKLNEFFRT